MSLNDACPVINDMKLMSSDEFGSKSNKYIVEKIFDPE